MLWPVVQDILEKCNVDSSGKACAKEIIKSIRKKNTTADGKNRKRFIVERVMCREMHNMMCGLFLLNMFFHSRYIVESGLIIYSS